MENEIKVGEYCRYDDGTIIKVVEEEESLYNYLLKNKKGLFKHSPNIIDLIEVGDYVNGRLIHKVDIRKNSSYIYYGNGKTFTDYQIETVVTKEQFESITYKVTKM